ncbi:T-cell surface glycoprotein CD3 delta chain [Anarrhichthys ocellatus]|uniref:T-cell surface glycoprotein CD3 delta chain n=1 Tax=Anarrhichthys ocellatus TaxID=433405 RepID=UPI0012EDE2FD|nr:T-cell surface glycoprotein CD3 delta chain-like [Anarrhichthys ocellatus]XP_031717152.1 T-cell surface glycoprotein CD3 delta chain-like [Anarrhichthys ocellatus]
MKSVLAACLLLLWTLTAPVSCDPEIVVTEVFNGIKLRCTANYLINSKDEELLEYKDENTGEYTFWKDDQQLQIFMKFRTCDNCVELDTASITGMVVGDVVATIVIGVAVYLIASLNRIGPVTSPKKSSDRPRRTPNEGSRGPNDTYQPLKKGHRDTYDVLRK